MKYLDGACRDFPAAFWKETLDACSVQYPVFAAHFFAINWSPCRNYVFPATRLAQPVGADAIEQGIAIRKSETVALPWYTEQDYETVRNLMADKRNMPRTFEAWARTAAQVEKETVQVGGRVIRAVIEPRLFETWCKNTGSEMNAWARFMYANMVARTQDK